MHRRSQGSENLVPFNPEIEATVQRKRDEARRIKEGIVVMAEGDNIGATGLCSNASIKDHFLYR